MVSLRQAGDEPRLTVHLDPSQGQGRGSGESPAPGELAVDPVTDAEGPAAEVEPQFPLEVELIRARVRIAAATLGQCHDLAGRQAIGGQVGPGGGNAGLAWVHCRRAAQLDLAQVGPGRKGPDLDGRPGRGRVATGQGADGPVVMGTDFQHPVTWAHLDA